MPRQSYWILLTAPHITETYIPPEGDQWTYELSPKYIVKKGDIVYLWLNYQMGFYGWGEIAETPKIIVEPETKDSKGRKRQVVTVNRKKCSSRRLLSR